MSGLVYFIQALPSGLIKIGFTSGPVENRLSSLQTGSGERLVVLTTIGGSRDTEKALHDRFDSVRTGGEWFEPSPQLLAFIDGAIAASVGVVRRASSLDVKGQLLALATHEWQEVPIIKSMIPTGMWTWGDLGEQIGLFPLHREGMIEIRWSRRGEPQYRLAGGPP